MMKTIKTILMIALFSMTTISCTDLTAEDELTQNAPIESVVNPGDSDTNTPPPPPSDDGTGTDEETPTDPIETGNTGDGKGN